MEGDHLMLKAINRAVDAEFGIVKLSFQDKEYT